MSENTKLTQPDQVIEILAPILVKGKSIKEIAQQFSVSDTTVKRWLEQANWRLYHRFKDYVLFPIAEDEYRGDRPMVHQGVVAKKEGHMHAEDTFYPGAVFPRNVNWVSRLEDMRAYPEIYAHLVYLYQTQNK